MTIVVRSRRARDIARRNRLVEAHTMLIAPMARILARSLPASIEIDDLVGAGQLGLIQAAETYDPAKHGGAPFSAWARVKIRGAMLDSIRRRHWTNATAPGLEEAPEPHAESNVVVSIDQGRAKSTLLRAIDQLEPRLREVVMLHDIQGLKLAEVGERLGVCASRASQLHVEALRILRTSPYLRGLDEAA